MERNDREFKGGHPAEDLTAKRFALSVPKRQNTLITKMLQSSESTLLKEARLCQEE